MCIRDSPPAGDGVGGCPVFRDLDASCGGPARPFALSRPCPCLLYTSDAADERSSVDLGGRRIIKKKKKRGYRVAKLRLSTVQDNRIV